MTDRAKISLTALSLMQRALELLDNIEERLAACHLQHAIDVMTDEPTPSTEAEVEAMLDTPEARALLHRLC